MKPMTITAITIHISIIPRRVVEAICKYMNTYKNYNQMADVIL